MYEFVHVTHGRDIFKQSPRPLMPITDPRTKCSADRHTSGVWQLDTGAFVPAGDIAGFIIINERPAVTVTVINVAIDVHG
jgi:hypothetical protein